jgi:hypothetical protein
VPFLQLFCITTSELEFGVFRDVGRDTDGKHERFIVSGNNGLGKRNDDLVHLGDTVNLTAGLPFTT